MKNNNSYFFISIFILTILIPFYSNYSANEINILNKNRLLKFNNHRLKVGEDKEEKERERYYRGKKEEREEEEKRNTTELIIKIEEFEKKKQDLTINIQKDRIMIIFLSILAGILFIILVIYTSIKCFLLCSKNSFYDYRLSKISINKLGEVYIDESIRDKDNNYYGKKISNYGAPINANNNNDKNSKKETFNPDNYSASNEDKKLYKPYKTEELQ